MLEAATITASRSEASTPASFMACSAARQAISHMTDGSSLCRSGISGTIRLGSRMPALLITNRDLIPEAFSMNSAEEWVFASSSPAAIASLFSALYRSTQALNEVTSSSLLMRSAGVNSPEPVITAEAVMGGVTAYPAGRNPSEFDLCKAGEVGQCDRRHRSSRSSARSSQPCGRWRRSR